jgi:hypothetical protein
MVTDDEQVQTHNLGRGNHRDDDWACPVFRASSHHRGGFEEPELHRRGYGRVATTATCGFPRGQFDVALVDWRLHSIKALEATLDWLVHFLKWSGVLVIRVDSEDRAGNRKLKSMLESLGFRIEVGTRCERGVAISARRRAADQQAIAAWAGAAQESSFGSASHDLWGVFPRTPEWLGMRSEKADSEGVSEPRSGLIDRRSGSREKTCLVLADAVTIAVREPAEDVGKLDHGD